MLPPSAETELARAERHVDEGERRIAKQRQRIERLTDISTTADALLRELERSQALLVSDRDRLREERGR